jgi:hypothetical protein
VEEMLRVGGRNPSMEMTDDAKKGGYLQITLRRPSQYKLEVEVDVRIMHTL